MFWDYLVCVWMCVPRAHPFHSPSLAHSFFHSLCSASFSPRAIIQSTFDHQCIASSHQLPLVQIDNYRNEMTWKCAIWVCMWYARNQRILAKKYANVEIYNSEHDAKWICTVSIWSQLNTSQKVSLGGKRKEAVMLSNNNKKKTERKWVYNSMISIGIWKL